MFRFPRLVAMTLLFACPLPPAQAYEVYLDHNTDGLIQTFSNLVVGPETAEIDVVLDIGPSDLPLTYVQAHVFWGFGDTDPNNPGCSEIFGSVQYIPYGPLPDSGPFTDLTAYSCVCRDQARCHCDSTFLIEGNVSGLATPGLYKLATFTFSRRGTNIVCQSVLYSEADFTTGSSDPRGTLTIQTDPTGVETQAWGRIKAMYR